LLVCLEAQHVPRSMFLELPPECACEWQAEHLC
jgi:hypothetical protein